MCVPCGPGTLTISAQDLRAPGDCSATLPDFIDLVASGVPSDILADDDGGVMEVAQEDLSDITPVADEPRMPVPSPENIQAKLLFAGEEARAKEALDAIRHAIDLADQVDENPMKTLALIQSIIAGHAQRHVEVFEQMRSRYDSSDS